MRNLEFSTPKPPVSVIICAYNAEGTISETLSSLLAQTYKNLEILVIDDASTDSTAAVCKLCSEQDPRVRVYRHVVNKGLAHARKSGVENCSYDLLAFLDADDIAMPEMIEKMVSKIISDHDILGVSAYGTYFREDKNLGTQKIGPVTRDEYMKLYLNKKLIFISNPNLVRKKDLLSVGGYRVDILPNPQNIRHADFCEDLDTWCRMSDLSIDGRYFITLAEPLWRYRKPAESMSTKNLKYMQNKMRWIKDCLLRRRAGEPERSLAEFIASRSWLDRINDHREDAAAGFYKRAGFAYSSRNYFLLGIFLTLTIFCSPKLIRQKIKTQTTRTGS